MVNSVVLLVIGAIIVGCAVYLYLKGTLIKSFAMAIDAVCAGALALGFYEILFKTLIGFAGSSDLLEQWGPMICFVLLFIVAFAVMQTVINILTREPIDFGFWPERIGRALCGAFLGFTVSRVLIAVLIMSFLPGLQTSTLGVYLGYKGISPPKQTQQKKVEKPIQNREASAQKEAKSASEKGKLSDTSKSILGPDFE